LPPSNTERIPRIRDIASASRGALSPVPPAHSERRPPRLEHLRVALADEQRVVDPERIGQAVDPGPLGIEAIGRGGHRLELDEVAEARDEVRGLGRLLAELEPAVDRVEIGVALVQRPAILDAER